MAQLSNPQWLPATGNPLPTCSTTVTFTPLAGGAATGVRVTYTIRGSQVQFDPSPNPPGSTPGRRTANTIVDDYLVMPPPSPIQRTLNLRASGQPATETLDVSIADLVGGVPQNAHSSSAVITFSTT